MHRHRISVCYINGSIASPYMILYLADHSVQRTGYNISGNNIVLCCYKIYIDSECAILNAEYHFGNHYCNYYTDNHLFQSIQLMNRGQHRLHLHAIYLQMSCNDLEIRRYLYYCGNSDGLGDIPN